MDRHQLANALDQAYLRPEMTASEVEAGCLEMARLGVGCVCVRPWDVPFVASALEGTPVTVATVIGFPHGTSSTSVKSYETLAKVLHGAEELDMVINIGALKGGDFEYVEEDIRQVVEAAQGRIVKVILETAFLTDEEKREGCQIAEAAGASFVKTSTGFATTGATLSDVRLMKAVVGDRMGVKASGGIKTLEAALAFIDAGATRIGTSASATILAEFERTNG